MDVDAIVIGGGVAGLQSALTLGRACRRVLVVDAGQTRNRFAPHSHNLLTRDGTPPAELVRLGRRDLALYDVSFIAGRVTAVARVDHGFEVTLDTGATRRAGGLVFATGQRDRLPPIPGVAEAWGRSVFACPYCHGWEFRGRPLAVLGQDDYAAHMVRLISAWTPNVHLLTNGPWAPGAEAKVGLGHFEVHHGVLSGLDVEASALRGVRFADGHLLQVDGLLLRPETEPQTALLESLGVELTDAGLPKIDMMQASSVPGVFVAGDLGWMMASLSFALSSGMMAGAGLNHHLVAVNGGR